MTLKRSFALYLAVFHLLFLAVAALLLVNNLWWLLLFEAAFVVSVVWGIGIARRLFGALSAGSSGAQLLNEGDFQSRLRETGHEETDQLIRVYNRMADRLREERARLHEQQYLLSKILDVSPSGIVILDFDGRATFVNARAVELLELPSGRLSGWTPDEIDSPLGRVVSRLPPGESEVVTLWGGRRVRCHRGAFIDRGFQRTFVLLEELTEELRQHEKNAYERMIRMLSHEVNNSMGAAHSLLQSCLTYAPQLREADRRDFDTALRVVSNRTRELSAFMRAFAEVVRIPPPQLQPQGVRELLESTAVLLGPASAERRIQWQWHLDEDVAPVPMDCAQMEQVFVNVCKNAIEAIGSDGTITIRLGHKDGRACVVVEDSGPGIPEEVRRQLFTPFFSTKEHGQGIGLMLVQEILSQHRFDYALESRPGGPTRFTICFS